jgi:hypothetical protein
MGPHETELHRTHTIAALHQLVDKREIDDGEYVAAVHLAATTGVEMEEALITLGALEERALLQHLATYYDTKYLSTERLAKAEAVPNLRVAVPRELLEHLRAFPIKHPSGDGTITLAVVEPLSIEAFLHLRLALGAREIRVAVARPEAIRALIAKHYDEDEEPFRKLLGRREDESGVVERSRPCVMPPPHRCHVA